MRTQINSLFELIGDLARKRHALAEEQFARLGLTHTEARLLTLLGQVGGNAPQDVISQGITIDRSNVGRSFNSLEQRGYVQRRQHFADKRAKVVALTEKGNETVAEIQRIREEMAATFFGDLTEEQAGEILNTLQRAIGADALGRDNG